MILFLLGQHHSPSSSGASKLASCSAFSPSRSLFPTRLIVYAVGPPPICPPLKQSRISLLTLPLPLPLPLFPVPPSSLSPYQSGSLPFDTTFPPILRHLFCHSCIHQLLFLDATRLIRSVLSCLFSWRLCTLSKRSHTRRRTTCRCSRPGHSVSRRPHIFLIHGYWSVVGHHFVDDDLQFLHDFVELYRSRQELPFDVLRHHLPHRKRLLRFTRFGLMFVLGHFQ